MSSYVNIGSAPNDGTGDPLRVAFDRVNEFLSLLESRATLLEGRIASLEGINAQFAPVNHDHNDAYALLRHTHDGFALVDHTHSGFALLNHAHPELALASHTHTQYAEKGSDGKLSQAVLPVATETAPGAVQRATEALALAGESNAVFMTPSLTKKALDAAPTPPLTGVTVKASRGSTASRTFSGDRNTYYHEASANFTFRFVSSAPTDEVVAFDIVIKQNTTGSWRGSFPDLAGWIGGVPAVSVPSGQSASVVSPYLDREAGRRGILHVTRRPDGLGTETAWFASWTRID